MPASAQKRHAHCRHSLKASAVPYEATAALNDGLPAIFMKTRIRPSVADSKMKQLGGRFRPTKSMSSTFGRRFVAGAFRTWLRQFRRSLRHAFVEPSLFCCRSWCSSAESESAQRRRHNRQCLRVGVTESSCGGGSSVVCQQGGTQSQEQWQTQKNDQRQLTRAVGPYILRGAWAGPLRAYAGLTRPNT